MTTQHTCFLDSYRRAGLFCLLLAAAFTVAVPIQAEEAASLKEALKKGDVTVDFRYRYENVSDDAVGDKEAHASTLRTVINYRTQAYKGWGFFLEAENVTAVGNDQYNNAGRGSLNNGVRDRPVVADPALTELNQAYLSFEKGKTRMRAGRQEIIFGDHRFVGNVGWRQNHQSFDALTASDSSLARTSFHYAFVDTVNRIFGDRLEMASHLLNAAFDVSGAGKLTLYGFYLDYDDAVALSTSTFGAELSGKQKLGGGSELLYEIEVVDQRDAGDNPATVDAGYLFASLGGRFSGVTVKGGWERLDGSPGEGQFNTPLATLHKFNGWADKFLRTPGQRSRGSLPERRRQGRQGRLARRLPRLPGRHRRCQLRPGARPPAHLQSVLGAGLRPQGGVL